MSGSDRERCDVLFLIRSMGRGGAERQLSLLARTLQTRGLKIVVAVFYAGGARQHELRDVGVEVLDLGKAGRWSNLGVIHRLMAFVGERRPRVLHSYMPTQNVFALLLRPWLKRHGCVVACGIRTASFDARPYGLVSRLLSWGQRQLIAHADCVISNSVQGLKELESRIPPGRGHAIPNGVEYGRFSFLREKRDQQRGAWSVPDGFLLLGLVGRLDPQKNHVLLIDALRLAGHALEHVRLVFAGDGPVDYQRFVRAHAEATGMTSRLLWVGPSDHMDAVYSALDILCLCSPAEGFPNVLAEAMCAGLPCVTTDVGDCTMLVGDCGWVVPPGDAQALADVLLQACLALPDWDRERPRRRMVEEFSVDALADRTLAALSPFLGEPRP